MRDGVERMRERQKGRCAQSHGFDRKVAEMLVEPRAPHGANRVARLQNRAQARARPAAHQTEMPPMPARQQFEDGVRLSVSAYAQHHCFVGPFHATGLAQTAWQREGSRENCRGPASPGSGLPEWKLNMGRWWLKINSSTW